MCVLRQHTPRHNLLRRTPSADTARLSHGITYYTKKPALRLHTTCTTPYDCIRGQAHDVARVLIATGHGPISLPERCLGKQIGPVERNPLSGPNDRGCPRTKRAPPLSDKHPFQRERRLRANPPTRRRSVAETTAHRLQCRPEDMLCTSILPGERTKEVATDGAWQCSICETEEDAKLYDH